MRGSPSFRPAAESCARGAVPRGTGFRRGGNIAPTRSSPRPTFLSESWGLPDAPPRAATWPAVYTRARISHKKQAQLQPQLDQMNDGAVGGQAAGELVFDGDRDDPEEQVQGQRAARRA